MILAFLLRHLRNRGDLEWLGLGIIDEEEEGRREEAMTRAMRARILGLVGEVMGRDTDMEATPLVKPELDEVELHLEGGAGEGRMKEWSVSPPRPSSASFQNRSRRLMLLPLNLSAVVDTEELRSKREGG